MEITLRTWQPQDAPRVYQLANNAKVARNLRDAFPHPYHPEDAEQYIETCRRANPLNVWVYAVCADGELVGSIGVFRQQDVYRRCAEIGYWLGEPYWGKGIMARAARMLCDQVFEESDIVRIEAEVFSWNPASGRVLEKAGFALEGVHRCKVFKDGEFLDGRLYARIKGEQEKE